MGKPGISVPEFRHLALQFFVGHSGDVIVDDAKVGRWDFVGREIAVGGCCVEHKASTHGVPFLRFVLLFCLLLLDVVKLLVLDFVLVLGFLGGARDPGGQGPKDVGGIRCGGGGGRGLNAWHDMGVVEAGAPFCKLAVIWGNGESCLCHLSLVDSDAPKIE